MKKPDADQGKSPSQLISERIAELGDWRGETLARVRKLIHEADPEITEEWKWRGVPVWSDGGIVCTGESYKTTVKLTFAKGASIADPQGVFNASLDGNARRAIDLHEGDELDEPAFKARSRRGQAELQEKEIAALAARGRAPARAVGEVDVVDAAVVAVGLVGIQAAAHRAAQVARHVGVRREAAAHVEGGRPAAPPVRTESLISSAGTAAVLRRVTS